MRKWQGAFWSYAIVLAVILTGCGSDKVFDNSIRGPLSVTTIPADGDTNVPVNQIITATFNKTIEPTTIDSSTVYLTDGSITIDGNLSVDAVNRTAIFVPASDLDYNTTYHFFVTTGVETPSGEHLASIHETTFTTGESTVLFSSVMVAVDGSALAVDSNKSELLNPIVGGLLGTNLKVDVLTTKGLADVQLGLLEFLGTANEEVGAKSVGALLDAEISVEQVLEVTSDMLKYEDEQEVRAAIDQLREEVSSGPLAGAPLQLSSVVRLSEEMRSKKMEEFLAMKELQNSQVNTLALISTLNDILNPLLGSSIELPLSLPPLLDSVIKLQVVSPPAVAELREGETVHSAVTRLYLNLGVGQGGLAGLLGVLDTTTATSSDGQLLDLTADIVRLPLYVELGSTEATLMAIDSKEIVMKMTSGLARLYLGNIDEDVYFSNAATLGADDFEPIEILNVLGLIKITAKGFAAGEGYSEEVRFLPAPAMQTTTVMAPVGSDLNGLLTTLLKNLVLKINLLGIEIDLSDITALLGGVFELLFDTVLPLTGGLVDSVGSLLGVYVGKAEITLQGVME